MMMESRKTIQSAKNDERVLADLQRTLEDLERTPTMSKEQLTTYCESFENKVAKQLKTPHYRFPYWLLLIELYGIKLGNYQKAEQLCNRILKDNSVNLQIHVETLLRLSYILGHQRKYHDSIKALNNIFSIMKDRKQLEEIVSRFYAKLFDNSIHSTLLKGLRAEQIDKDYQKAIDLYTQQFNAPNEDLTVQSQNKYFAAMSILQLLLIFPHQKFQGVHRTECLQYKARMEQQEPFEHQEQESMNDRYIQRKTYLSRIIKFSERTRMSIQVHRNSNEQNELYMVIAHLKLIRIQNTTLGMDKQTLAELRNFHNDLKIGKVKNKFIIMDFVSSQYHAVQSMLKIRQQIVLYHAFQTLKKPRELVYSQKNSISKETSKKAFMIPDELDPLFRGSFMQKINSNSRGHSVRYFYYRQEEFNKRFLKLYYCSQKSKSSPNNNFYDIHEIQFSEGNKSKTFKLQPEYRKLPESQCFTLITKEREISFYVEDKTAYRNWKILFKIYIEQCKRKIIKIKQIKDIPQAKSKWSFFH